MGLVLLLGTVPESLRRGREGRKRGEKGGRAVEQGGEERVRRQKLPEWRGGREIEENKYNVLL